MRNDSHKKTIIYADYYLTEWNEYNLLLNLIHMGIEMFKLCTAISCVLCKRKFDIKLHNTWTNNVWKWMSIVMHAENFQCYNFINS